MTKPRMMPSLRPVRVLPARREAAGQVALEALAATAVRRVPAAAARRRPAGVARRQAAGQVALGALAAAGGTALRNAARLIEAAKIEDMQIYCG